MIKIVKRILFRRSGTRNMFRSRDNIGASTSSPSGYRSLPVAQRVSASRWAAGRPTVPGSSRPVPRRPRWPGLRPARSACARTVRARVSSPRPRILTRPRFGDETVRAEHTGVDLVPDVEGLERVEVHDHVLDAERVAETFRLRGAAVERGLATLEARRHVVARTGALHAAPGGLAALAGDAAADPPCGPSSSPGGGFRSWTFMAETSSTRDEVRHPRDHPAYFGLVGVLHRVVDPAQAERAERAALLRLGADRSNGPG